MRWRPRRRPLRHRPPTVPPGAALGEILAFCSGHSVLEEFVQPFMEKIIEILKNQKIEELKQTINQASEKVIHERVSSIEKMAKKDIVTELSDSFTYIIYHNVDQNMEKIKEKLAKELN